MKSTSLACLTAALLTALCVAAGARAQASASPPESTVITSGEDWIALTPGLDIEPRSALDFSEMRFVDPPAGKHGRLIARRDGQFAFSDTPDVPRRFYGTNLCFGAQYLTHQESDRLAQRLARLGYNALRIHHYEGILVEGQATSTSLSPEKLDEFDYLMAALIRRGIYLTTDLYVSRPVPFREVGIDREGIIPMDTFKILVPVHEGAFENWKAFTRALLSHRNPYTKRTYAQEPALAWIALINEGNFGNFYGDLVKIPEWKQAWNRWLAQRYSDRESLATAWGSELKQDEDPASQTVALPQTLWFPNPRVRDCILFFGDTERDMAERMKTFLRDELNCQALLTNGSSWTRYVTDQAVRAGYDYIDDHFYVDHPLFLKTPWELPSRCPNTSPVAAGAPGGRSMAFTRLFGKPFTCTEYNYSGPGRFRGVGGLLTGALGALQGWGGIWRFTYSQSREAMYTPSPISYFETVSDPLSQAAERAALCLFLRGDIRTAPQSVALVMTRADLAQPPVKIPNLTPAWNWLAWVTRVGTQVVSSPGEAWGHAAILPLGWQTPASAYEGKPVVPLAPYGLDDNNLIASLQLRDMFSPGVILDPAHRMFRSETGEVTIDGPGDRLILDTARTAGGFAPLGQTIETAQAGVKISIEGADATVWVSSLDDKPIQESSRLLVTHLTDLQNTGIRYAEPARQTLLDWGGMPYLVRAGKATVTLRLKSPRKYRVWALSVTGKRVAQVPAQIQGDALSFTADVAADRAHGARMIYEVARK
jgi:hypothetical protein